MDDARSELWRVFREAAGSDAPLDADVLDAIEQRAADAAQHWRDAGVAALPSDVVVAGLGRGVRGLEPARYRETIESLQVVDLYLCLAAVRDDAAALREMDIAIRRVAGRVTARMGGDPQELAQLIRVRALAPTDDGQRRVLQYAGRGTLESWLRIVGTRALLNARRGRAAPELAMEFAEPITLSTPEVAAMRAEYQDVFSEALRGAFEALTSRERSLLKDSLLLGKTVTELGAQHGVHLSTAARWLVKARERLLQGFRRQLRQNLSDSAEVGQLLTTLQSRIGWDEREFFDE